MKCPKCQFENTEDSKFCLECGQEFELICPHCNKALPISAKYCNGCGHYLTKPGEDSHNLNIYQDRPFPVHVVLPVVGVITDKQGVQQFKAGAAKEKS